MNRFNTGDELRNPTRATVNVNIQRERCLTIKMKRNARER